MPHWEMTEIKEDNIWAYIEMLEDRIKILEELTKQLRPN